MIKVVSVAQMREVEKEADASGLTYSRMMEKAGRSVAQAIAREYGSLAGRRITVLAGPGNNGGDGLVAAHWLAMEGAEVDVFLAKERPSSDPNLLRLRGGSVPVHDLAQEEQREAFDRELQRAGIFVDAVFGTGTRPPLRGAAADLLARAKAGLEARETPSIVVSVDCPSGLDCDTGEVAPQTIRAGLTVTLAAVKQGLLRFPGAEYVGKILVGDIGLGPDTRGLKDIDWEFPVSEDLRPWLPPRPRLSHKGTFGRAVVVAGSVNFPGAAVLAARSAYRVGAGLVTLAVPSAVYQVAAPQIPEATWMILPDELGVIAAEAAEILPREMGEAQAMVLGPGFGLQKTTAEFLRRLLSPAASVRSHLGFSVPEHDREPASPHWPRMLIDADGLKLLRQLDAWWDLLPAGSVLTPHPGEMAILTGLSRDEIQADREGVARRFAKEWNVILVLKGAFSIVVSPQGRTAVIPFATSALARAGTGDVLSGTIGGLLAQGVPSWEAAVLGAYLHGWAGERAAKKWGSTAPVMAGDVSDTIGEAVSELESGRRELPASSGEARPGPRG
ncbi:MAG: NAD(P)H-hydrate dehydratase [Anaerolineales bacterium]|jgi:NAD(P)H-hydrate epimerase